jgi:hypothetical protein
MYEKPVEHQGFKLGNYIADKAALKVTLARGDALNFVLSKDTYTPEGAKTAQTANINTFTIEEHRAKLLNEKAQIDLALDNLAALETDMAAINEHKLF